ncbi:hypothetical protein PS918_02679 [Pseudomonas fluorescens]|uniref:Uncharacterized protein n=1 Tax=Pseudomonas fluorescens TaxID=294 RepID=A0A5E7SFS5_PSEFL|nr:hypothetical protein [Pseudomonas fluorescens]VVP84914.1 hypothetical protein PS918_02679 [Pseudomonas fluorescens]
MKAKDLSSSSVIFIVERLMSRHGCFDNSPCVASVEVADNHASFLIDDSEYCFTAQQCAEVAKNLARLLLIYSGLGICPGSAESVLRLEAYTSWYRLIEAQTIRSDRDLLQIGGLEKKGFEFCASGSFQRPESQSSEPDYYSLTIALDDELDLPCLGIEDRVFSFDFEDAFWLVKQLWIAGNLLAQTD